MRDGSMTPPPLSAAVSDEKARSARGAVNAGIVMLLTLPS